MTQLTTPLSDSELDQLEAFLQTAGPAAMNFEELDGFLAALVCTPSAEMPYKHLTEIFGEGFRFKDEYEANYVLNLVMRHWNTIARELRQGLTEDHVYLPILFEHDDGLMHGNDWSNGFTRVMQLYQDAWSPLMHDDEAAGSLIPVLALAHEHDPDPVMRPEPITPERRQDIIQHMIAGLTHIYRYFEPDRLAHAASKAPFRRAEPKVGRNDPCPCNSGKKFKACCGKTGA